MPLRRKWFFLAGTIALSASIEPVFALNPVPDPAGEARTRGGVAKLGAERLGSRVRNLPHVPAVRAGDDQVPVHGAAVGAQYERAMITDGVQQWAELLIRTLIALPHPRFDQWEWLGEITCGPGRRPALRQAPQLDHAKIRRPCGTVSDLGDAGAIRLGQHDALLFLEGVHYFPAQRRAVREGTAEYR